MRAHFLITVSMATLSGLAPAYALQASDTMKAWKASSIQERAELLGKILGRDAGSADSAPILTCLNDTSNLPGHSDLTIREVAKFCASAKDADQPV